MNTRAVLCLVVGTLLACGGAPEAPNAGSPDASGPPDASSDIDAGETRPPPEVVSITPETGLAGIPFAIAGRFFQEGASVSFGAAAVTELAVSSDGTAITGTLPERNPADDSVVAVRVRNPDGREVTVDDAFTYLTTPPTPPLQWCRLLDPHALERWSDGEPSTIRGRAYHPDITMLPGEDARVFAQATFGAEADPLSTWNWADATWTADEGNDDVYALTFPTPAAGSYRYAFRFSLDGSTWTYCDADEAGSDDGFDVAHTGTLVVRTRPRIDAITPSSARAGETITATGVGFTSAGLFKIGSTSASATVADGGESAVLTVPPGAGSVTVSFTYLDAVASSAAGAFTYVEETPALQWCRLLDPHTIERWSDDERPAIQGRAYHPDITSIIGADARVVAQAGFGAEAEPLTSWTWTDAAWTADEGNDDVYALTLPMPNAGTYRYAFRFSLDGETWTYCDGDESGSDDGFLASHAGSLVVRTRPRIDTIAPSSARAGATITVTGAGFTSEGSFRIGGTAASATVAEGGASAALTVPPGAGSVAVSFTYLDAVARSADGAFTYIVDPMAPAITGISPQVLPFSGGTLEIAGSNFAQPLSVFVGESAASITSVATNRIVVNVPRLRPGSYTVTLGQGGMQTTAPQPLVFSARHTPTLDGTITANDWPTELRIGTNTVSTWGSNELKALYAAYDDTSFYVAVEGRAEAQNAIVGYLGTTQLAIGTADLRTLSDGNGALDDALSGPWYSNVAGFAAQFGFGSFGTADDLVDDAQDGRGLRAFGCEGCLANFAWSRATVRRGANAVEFAFPWNDGTVQNPPNAFVPFPAGGATFRLFVRLVTQDGQTYPADSLPQDPNLADTDPLVRTRVSAVASVFVK